MSIGDARESRIAITGLYKNWAKSVCIASKPKLVQTVFPRLCDWQEFTDLNYRTYNWTGYFRFSMKPALWFYFGAQTFCHFLENFSLKIFYLSALNIFIFQTKLLLSKWWFFQFSFLVWLLLMDFTDTRKMQSTITALVTTIECLQLQVEPIPITLVSLPTRSRKRPGHEYLPGPFDGMFKAQCSQKCVLKRNETQE